MMIKKSIILFGICLGLLFWTIAYSQEDMVVIDNSVFENPQRPPALFSHDTHNEIAEIEECNKCHHLYEDGELIEDESSEDQRCSDCHSQNLMEAFHTNCKGCHNENKAGPIMCGECHVK